MEFNNLLNLFARDLPSGYVVKICVEQGAAWVEVERGEEVRHIDFDSERSAEEIVTRNWLGRCWP